jgi:hypothetical protein
LLCALLFSHSRLKCHSNMAQIYSVHLILSCIALKQQYTPLHRARECERKMIFTIINWLAFKPYYSSSLLLFAPLLAKFSPNVLFIYSLSVFFSSFGDKNRNFYSRHVAKQQQQPQQTLMIFTERCGHCGPPATKIYETFFFSRFKWSGRYAHTRSTRSGPR